MREDDPRGRRLAIVAHELLNAHLAEDTDAADALSALEDLGYGLMALPPLTQAEAVRLQAVEQLVEQLQDYLRHGYRAVIVEGAAADPLPEALDAGCRRYGIDPPLCRLRTGRDFRRRLELLEVPA